MRFRLTLPNREYTLYKHTSSHIFTQTHIASTHREGLSVNVLLCMCVSEIHKRTILGFHTNTDQVKEIERERERDRGNVTVRIIACTIVAVTKLPTI